MGKVEIAIAVSILAACGGQQQGDGPCGPGRTLVDNVCVAEKVADFIVCIRSRGEVALKADQSRGLTAEAQVVGQKVSTVMEAKNQLEARYTTQGGAEGERQVIEQCSAMVKETQPAGGALPTAATSGAAARGNAVYFEDFSGVTEGGAPQGWLGAEHFAARGGAFTCFEKGPIRLGIPTGTLPADYRAEVVFRISAWGWGGLRVQTGSLSYGLANDFGTELAFVNGAKKPIDLVENVPVTLAVEKRGDVYRAFVDGREVVLGRYPDVTAGDTMTVAFWPGYDGGCDAAGNAVLHRVAVYPL